MAVDGDAVLVQTSTNIKNSPRSSSTAELKKYTREEVMTHNTPEDCWMVIDGKVYDVTSWVPKHPGGSLIYVRAGEDCTYNFNSYHPLYVWKLLNKYCIGEIIESPKDLKLGLLRVEYLNSVHEPFYITLKQRVEAHFRKNKIDPRIHPQLFLKTILLLSSYVLFYYLTYFHAQSHIITSIYASVLGFLISEVVLSITHDANHGAYSSYLGLSFLMGLTQDLVGVSSYTWKQYHVGAHHPFTNLNEFDQDMTTGHVDPRRLHADQRHLFFHKYQHIYMWPGYGTAFINAIWIMDFKMIATGRFQKLRLTKMTGREVREFWTGKLVYIIYMVVLPLTFGVHTWSGFLSFYILSQVVAGLMLAIIFQSSHVVNEAFFPHLTIKNGVPTVPHGWAEMQVRSTVNFSTDSLFMVHFTGGINLQIEHHLFPGVCHMHCRTIQPIVEATCKEFNIPYKRHTSLFDAMKSHFHYLKSVGGQKMDLITFG